LRFRRRRESIGVGDSAMDDRRKTHRGRMLKAAKIIFNNRRSILDCTARDITDDGACLIVGNLAGVPDAFELQVPVDNLKRHCRVIWKRAGRIGVRFGSD
jgi:PilZ domain